MPGRLGRSVIFRSPIRRSATVAADFDWSRAVPLFMSEIEAMGGAERSLLALGRWLHRHGRPSYLLTFTDRLGLEQHADFPLPTVEICRGGGLRRKLSALRIHFKNHSLREHPPSDAAPITSGYQPALYASLAGLGTFHCLMHDTASLFSPREERSSKQRVRLATSNRLIGRGMRRGGGIMIVTSEFLRRECRRDFGVQAEIARMGGLGQGVSFRRRPLEGHLRMLSVCRIEANKRVDWMLDALAALERSDRPLSARVNWTLTLAGKGTQLEPMREQARALGLAERIRFLGFVSDAELENLYDRAHLFLMPAVQGYGIPAIEALGRGIPVLLHRDSGVSDLLLDTPWAVVLNGGSETMRPGLEKLIDWLLRGDQITIAAPASLPTEESWAERVATLCGYI